MSKFSKVTAENAMHQLSAQGWECTRNDGVKAVFEKHTSPYGAHPNTKIRLNIGKPITYSALSKIEDKAGFKFER